MKAIFVFIVFLLLFQESVFAAAPVILNAPSSININDQFNLEATMSGLSSNSVYRLRIAIAQPSTTSYFGFTHNATDWYNGTPSPIDYTKFLSITTNSEGSWNGSILGKFDATDSNYKNTGSGTYDLKLGRYTENGSTATWSNVISVNLNAPSQTPTPTPTLRPSATNTPTLKPQSTIAPTQTMFPSTTKLSSVSNNNKKDISKSSDSFDVLGKSISITPEEKVDSSDILIKGNSKENDNLLPFIFITIGVVFLASCGIVFFYPVIKKWKDEKFS